MNISMLPACLGDDNRVDQPLWVMDFLYEVDIKQPFDLFTDEVLPLNRLLPGLLLDWSSIKVDPQVVLDHLPRDPKHL
jgi:hypothetical protein